jgi:hypothetical protein
MTVGKKSALLFLILSFALANTYAQDNTPVTFSEEADTSFVSQHFIDQYEAVFMTLVPTRHMFKYGSGIYPVSNIFLSPGRIGILTAEAGYEFKISPAFSIGADFSITNKTTSDPKTLKTYAVNTKGRWYFDMNKRIREGKNANNFSGDFFALSFDKRTRYTFEPHSLTSLGIEFGVQRRLFNDGRAEFTIGLNYQKYSSNYFISDAGLSTEMISDIALVTHTSLGGAFGDWKRAPQPPLCEILHCEQELNQQWKILWPNIYISSRIGKASLAFGYERKLARSPLSVNAQLNLDYRNIRIIPAAVYPDFKDNLYQIQPSLELRYYFLQKYATRRGLGGNNLSGLYVGPLADFIDFNSTFGAERKSFQHLGAGSVLGFQKTLFQRIYFDLYGSWSWNMLHTNAITKTGQGSLRLGLGWAI